MSEGVSKNHKSSNKSNDLNSFRIYYIFSDFGILWVGGAKVGGWGAIHMCAHSCMHMDMQVCHANNYMLRNCKWPTPCLSCLTCVCVHMHVCACAINLELTKIIKFSLKIYDLWRYPYLWMGAHMDGHIDGWSHGWGHVKSLKIK